MEHELALEKLEAYVDGELSPADRAALERHLADCPPCAAEVQSLRAMSAAIQQTPLPAVNPKALIRLHQAVAAANRRRTERFVAGLSAVAACLAIASGWSLMRPVTTDSTSSSVPLEIVIGAARLPDDTSATEKREMLVGQWMVASLGSGKNDND